MSMLICILPATLDPLIHSFLQQTVAASRDIEINTVPAFENYMDLLNKKISASVQCGNPLASLTGFYGNLGEKHLKLTGLGQGSHPKADGTWELRGFKAGELQGNIWSVKETPLLQ